MPNAAVPRFDTVTIDCPDPAALARFYGALLEWPAPEAEGLDENGYEGAGDYVALDPPEGGTAITFQRAAGFVAPTWPEPTVQQQMHLDLAVDDMETAHERAVALGARHLDTQEKFRVYADPAGHLFCLCSW
jgi:catechol 2,3-dioxygenase-like lactoylglutathione lyase family enzyme